MRRKASLLLAGALFITLAQAGRVSAHEETALDALTVIEVVTPHPPGVTFRVAHLTQPVLIATNRTKHPLVIFGSYDEPFLRIFDGRIETNANSPLTYSTRGPSGAQAPTPAGVNPHGPVVWRRVGQGRSWSWFDPRIRRGPTGADTWRVLAGLGPRKIEIAGSFESFDAHGHFNTRLESDLKIQDLEIQLNDGLVPAFYVRNETGRVLDVRGREGEPFLRIGPRGVFANLESPDYYLGGSQTIRAVPRSVDPADPPRWRKVSSVPIWTWLEFRARLPRSANLRSTLGDTRHPILRWKTPMAIGREHFSLLGVVKWIPPASEHPEAIPNGNERWILLLGVAVAGVAIGLLLWRTRAAAGHGAK